MFQTTPTSHAIRKNYPKIAVSIVPIPTFSTTRKHTFLQTSVHDFSNGMDCCFLLDVFNHYTRAQSFTKMWCRMFVLSRFGGCLPCAFFKRSWESRSLVLALAIDLGCQLALPILSYRISYGLVRKTPCQSIGFAHCSKASRWWPYVVLFASKDHLAFVCKSSSFSLAMVVFKFRDSILCMYATRTLVLFKDL